MIEKVRAGESVAIKASTWNAFIDAANFASEARHNQVSGGTSAGVGNGIILVKNGENTAWERFHALMLTDIAVTADANETEFISCAPVFIGKKMSTETAERPFAILLEPIGAGEIGRAMLMGITPAKVDIKNDDDAYAVPSPTSDTGALDSSSSGVARIVWRGSAKGEQWCLLQLGGAGDGTSNGGHISVRSMVVQLLLATR